MALFEHNKSYLDFVAKGFHKGLIIAKGYTIITEIQFSKPREDGSVQVTAQLKVFMSKDDTVKGDARNLADSIHTFYCVVTIPKKETSGDVYAALYPRVERLIVYMALGDDLDEKTIEEVDNAFPVRSAE